MKHQRRQKLINPRIQLAIAATFSGIALLALLLQCLLFGAMTVGAADSMPVGGNYLLTLMPSLLGKSLLLSLCVILPLTIAVGVLTTFRLVGPVYRFEVFLRDVLRGEQLGRCKIRKGDAFQDLCALLNEVTEPMRLRKAETSVKRDEPAKSPRAS